MEFQFFFNCTICVKQGCPLSPTLLHLFTQIVKEECIEHVVILFFVQYKSCGVYCKYFRRYTKSYEEIRRVLYA